MIRLALDVQHIHRTGIHARDRGATFTLHGHRIAEADVAQSYARTIASEILAAGGAVLLANDGSESGRSFVGPYSRRQRVAHVWGATAYLACHVNAGRGRYASVGHAATGFGAPRDTRLASAIAARLRLVPGLATVNLNPLRPGDRGFVCLYAWPANPVASVLLEPFFGDQVTHARFLEAAGAAELGRAIAAGVLDAHQVGV